LLAPGSGPADRATPANVARYIADLQALGNAPYTVLGRVRDLHNALKAMVPGHDWGWILRIARRLRRTVESVRDKRARIVPIDELFAYGLELMTAADGPSGGTPLARAIRYRDGLMLATLAARPVRRANFASIEIGRHLVRQGDGYLLVFQAAETKTGPSYESWIPEVLIPYLVRYLSHYRRFLAGRPPRSDPQRRFRPPGMALWISTFCSAMSEGAIYYRIRDLTKAKFGRSMSLHLFRDSAATSIATKDPAHVYITPTVLGHSSLATSEKHYNHARSLEASRSFQGQILELRWQDREHQN